MKRREFSKGLSLLSAAFVVGLPMSAMAQDKDYTIGFSQVTTVEPWRVQFNKDLRAEAELHENVNLLWADANDRTEEQVAQVENFIQQGVDAILISPKEAAGLTGVVEKATDAGIPVFVLDRNVDTDKFVQWVGGDNVLIGEAAGEFILEALGGAGNAQGTIVEIYGGLGIQATFDRSDPVHAAVADEAGVTFLLDRQSGDWKQDQAYDIMATALRNYEDITLVYGHNDPMAYGAYLAAKDAGRDKDIIFVGVDGLPGEGVTWVANGELAATFLYPTPGAEGLRQALRYLDGEQVEKSVVMGTEAITSANADEILVRNGLK
ncbi:MULTISPECIES: substrate-binding domain-containing protein [Falsihalocynthiibacter]|uniref:substrate-binding domain-containing protein n=1 Tax=Falsihalocynthiibacter TaxID=2854182 RepID=UPI0030029F13